MNKIIKSSIFQFYFFSFTFSFSESEKSDTSSVGSFKGVEVLSEAEGLSFPVDFGGDYSGDFGQPTDENANVRIALLNHWCFQECIKKK